MQIMIKILILTSIFLSAGVSANVVSRLRIQQDDIGGQPRVVVEVFVDTLDGLTGAGVKFWKRTQPDAEWDSPQIVKHKQSDIKRNSFLVELGRFSSGTEISLGAFIVEASGVKVWNNGQWDHFTVGSVKDGCVSTELSREAADGDVSGVEAHFQNSPPNPNFCVADTGRTALHMAFASYDTAKRGQYDQVIRLLLGQGSDPRIHDKSGYSVAELVETDGRLSPEIQNLILNKVSELNAHDRVQGPYWSTPLMYASEACDFDAMETLLKSGVNPNFQNPMSGKTALHFVLGGNRENKVQCANLLLKYGASPFIRDFGARQGPGLAIDDTLRWDDGFNLLGRTAMELIQDSNNRQTLVGLDLYQPGLVCQTQTPTHKGKAVLNSMFDAIYVLNLVESEAGMDRFEKFTQRIKPLGSFEFERFPGIYFNSKYGKKPGFVGDGILNQKDKLYDFSWFTENKRVAGIGTLSEGTLMGQIGVTLGHLQIIKKAKADGKKRILILEDDIAFSPFFIEATKNAIQELDNTEGKRWKLLYLDTNTRFLLHLMDIQKHKTVKRSYGMLMCSAWVINESAYDAIIERLSDIFDVSKPPLAPIDVVLANELQTSLDSYFVFPLPAYQDDGGFSQIGY